MLIVRSETRNAESKTRNAEDAEIFNAQEGFNHYDGFDCNNGIACDSSSEQLQAIQARVEQLAPEYWNLLQDSVCGIVRMTERVYVLQDWDRTGGYLVVYDLPLLSRFLIWLLVREILACLQNAGHDRRGRDDL